MATTVDHIIGSIVLFNADLYDWSLDDANNCHLACKEFAHGIAPRKYPLFWQDIHATFPTIWAKAVSTSHGINIDYFFRVLLAIQRDPSSTDTMLSKINLFKLFDRPALKKPKADLATLNLLLACKTIPALTNFVIFAIMHLLCIMVINELSHTTTTLSTHHFLRHVIITKCLEFEKLSDPSAPFLSHTIPPVAANVKQGIFKIMHKLRRG